MPRFEFKLEGVLKHRCNVEHQRQRELALVQGRMQTLQDQLRKLDLAVRQSTADLRRTGLVGRLDMSYLAAHRRFMISMQKQAVTLAQKIALEQRHVDEARLALAEASKQRKIVEKLREKLLQRWLEALNKRELEQTDEIGMQLAVRRLREDFAEDGSGEVL